MVGETISCSVEWMQQVRRSGHHIQETWSARMLHIAFMIEIDMLCSLLFSRDHRLRHNVKTELGRIKRDMDAAGAVVALVG